MSGDVPTHRTIIRSIFLRLPLPLLAWAERLQSRASGRRETGRRAAESNAVPSAHRLFRFPRSEKGNDPRATGQGVDHVSGAFSSYCL